MFNNEMRWLLIGASLIVSGCGLARSKEISAATSAAQLAKFSDDQLCNYYVDETPVVRDERARRNLGDCSPAHRDCIKMGFGSGTREYLACRQMLADAAGSNSARWAAIGAMGQTMLQQPPPQAPVVTCSRLGNITTCR